MYKSLKDGLTPRLEAVYRELDAFVKASGLRYNGDDECYEFTNVKEINCDYEMMASLENAHADLGYYLGKR